jgi:hypothetical protein
VEIGFSDGQEVENEVVILNNAFCTSNKSHFWLDRKARIDFT